MSCVVGYGWRKVFSRFQLCDWYVRRNAYHGLDHNVASLARRHAVKARQSRRPFGQRSMLHRQRGGRQD